MNLSRYRVKPGRRVSLDHWAADDTGGLRDKGEAAKLLARGIERLETEQEKLYAQRTWALLIVLQAMDAAGKDSTIKHVMSGVNPQGCDVHSFKAPSTTELDHDYLWRSAMALPERGRIGIHNRSYYEEVLVTRVHPELMQREQLPARVVGRDIWKRRFREINRFEHYLADNGIVVLKFFLHVSKEEQKRRFLDRLDQPEKWWKFQPGDLRERTHWREYTRAYEDLLQHTSTHRAPWYVVPADHKWFTRLVVADVIVETLRSLKLAYPKVSRATRAEWERARRKLLRD